MYFMEFCQTAGFNTSLMTKKGQKKNKVKKPVPKKAEEPEPQENPLDFGGLPQRDLKKNLGCG
jgi:hypothetical protein